MKFSVNDKALIFIYDIVTNRETKRLFLQRYNIKDPPA